MDAKRGAQKHDKDTITIRWQQDGQGSTEILSETMGGRKITVRPKNISELIPAAHKIEFESCKSPKHGKILNFRRKNRGIIRTEWIFFRNILN